MADGVGMRETRRLVKRDGDGSFEGNGQRKDDRNGQNRERESAKQAGLARLDRAPPGIREDGPDGARKRTGPS